MLSKKVGKNMIINEQKGDLFALDNNRYIYAHCISLDCAMGAGIAVLFKKKYPHMKRTLTHLIHQYRHQAPVTIPYFKFSKLFVFNLITKDRYWHKPTYDTIRECIHQMMTFCELHEIKFLAMPKIGCGLDGLDWYRVKSILEDEFSHLDITIEVRWL